MLINREINLKSFLLWGLILFYCIFFVNLITDHRSSFSLTYLLITLTIAYLFKSKKFYINPIIFIIGVSSAIFITLNEYIFHSHQTNTNIESLKQTTKYINQFLFVIPLIFLGTLFKYSNFTHKTLEKIVLSSTLFSLIFNTYLNLSFHFDRGLLITEFKSIILYDYCIITLSLISLIFSFTLKSKWSFVLILLSLLNISMITLHGSRGAWVGIPIALILITIYFYKTYQKQSTFMLVVSILLTIGMLIMPNSPLIERIDSLQSDTALMEKNNYNTSVGTRFALWRFAIDEFKQSPIIGNGFLNFQNKICAPNTKNEIPNCQPHAHNIIFQELAAHGVIGFFNILIIAVLSMYFFYQNLIRSENYATKTLAFTGLISVLYLMICSMSDYLWFYAFPTMFSFLIILTLMNIIYIENIKSNQHNNS